MPGFVGLLAKKASKCHCSCLRFFINHNRHAQTDLKSNYLEHDPSLYQSISTCLCACHILGTRALHIWNILAHAPFYTSIIKDLREKPCKSIQHSCRIKKRRYTMIITLLVLTIIILSVVLGVAFSTSLHKRGLHGGQHNYRKSQTTQLHEIIFLQH
jgi:hypothetical protein